MADLDSNNRFHISLPEDWVDQSVYMFNGPEVNGFQHNLTLVIDTALQDYDLESFARERIDTQLTATPGMELLKEEAKTLPSGTEAYEAVIKWIPVDGTIIFQKRVYLIVDEVGYSFTANFTKQTIKTIGLQVDQIIDSFKTGGAF